MRPSPQQLRTEYQAGPFGLYETEPRFSSRVEDDRRGVRPAAYRVLVASAAEQLAAGKGDFWDSGKAGSVYPGPIGAVFSPQLADAGASLSLPFASTLCGACPV